MWSVYAEARLVGDWSRPMLEFALRLFKGELRDNIKQVHAEMIANAVAASHPEDMVHVYWNIEPKHATLTVINEGCAWLPTNEQRANMAAMPDPEAEHGRGLPLMYRLSDSVEFAKLSNATLVRVTWRYVRWQEYGGVELELDESA